MLLGVTGSGKTFTMAQVISPHATAPALILAPNKTLAAQLYGEFKSFFPNNAVEYFVSYYDYYQPEAYVPRTDTYIEKESSINEQIDRMRHAATRSLLEPRRRHHRRLGLLHLRYRLSRDLYGDDLHGESGRDDQPSASSSPTSSRYNTSAPGGDFSRGVFRVQAVIRSTLFPAHYEDRAWRVGFFRGRGGKSIVEFDPLTGQARRQDLEFIKIYANSHYVTPRPTLLQSIKGIKIELKQRLNELYATQAVLLESPTAGAAHACSTSK